MAKSKPAAPVVTVTATEAKNRFGPLLETALRGGAVVITRHDAPKAVLLSMAEYEALRGATAPDLDDLAAQFDARVASLQSPAARKSLKAAFGAAPAELGRMAVAAQRRRG
ncbi:MAG: type II toxin-antitoxin system Phd/YefM family antitoxin [Vicinamibacterales bacterium]